MRKNLWQLLIALFVVTISHPLHAADKVPPVPQAIQNPLSAEMGLLNEAFKGLVEGIILNRWDKIEEPFHAVHMAKQKTHEALHHKQVFLPKNTNKVAEFVKMDETFHHDLEKMLGAVKKKDQKESLRLTHKLLDQCVACHNMFRAQ